MTSAVEPSTRPDAASEQALRDTLTTRPGDPAASLKLSLLLGSHGRHKEACDILASACEKNPGVAELHYNLGIALQILGAPAEALTSFENALMMNPEYAEAHSAKGVLLHARGDIDAARECYERAVDLAPRLSGAWGNLALCELAVEHSVEALEFTARAIDADPTNVDALLTRGMILVEFGRLDEALAEYNRAVAAAPDRAACYQNRAGCLNRMNRREEALADFRSMVERAPGNSAMRKDLAIFLSRAGRFDEALHEFEQAVAISPRDPDLRLHLGMAQLLKGDFRNGWRNYEARFDIPELISTYPRDHRWDGQPRPGSTILVRAEQGYGDSIQFIRLLPKLRQFGLKVVFECQPGMKSLLERAGGFDEIREWTGEQSPDASPLPEVTLLSLPYLMGIDLNSIPSHVPYLSADTDLIDAWRQRISRAAGASTADAVKIGICWAGRPTHENDRFRSVSLADFAPLAEIPNAVFYGLQIGPAAVQATDPPSGLALIDLSPDINSFDDTAAIVENLDLVITVDTSLAHLAGALGKPVWTLIRSHPDWRWMRDRTDSPWYPTMRLFRQSRHGDWSGVFDNVKEELNRLAGDPVGWQISEAEERFRSADETGRPAVSASIRRTALAALAEIARRHPENAQALNSLGALSWAMDDVEHAIDAFARAAALASDDPVITANLADALAAAGRTEAAADACRRFLSRREDAEIRGILDRVDHAGRALVAV